MTEIQNKLFQMQDFSYKKFHSSLMPTVKAESIIGVRTPLLRKYSIEIFKSGNYDDFLNSLPHTYYEENNLHGMLICRMKDYDKVIYELDRFLPHINNWATCDLTSPKIFKKHTDELVEEIKNWISSSHTYTVRFGIKMLMDFYLDDNFNEEHLKIVAKIKSDEYYIKMMLAWYFATALAKQYSSALPYIENHILDNWTHNKTISKVCESYRISAEHKAEIKQYRTRRC